MGTTSKERIREILKISGPHVFILLVVGSYIVIGGILFFHIETSSMSFSSTVTSTNEIKSEAKSLIITSFNETFDYADSSDDNRTIGKTSDDINANLTDILAMQNCFESDVEVIFDALYHGCCSASVQVTDECFNVLKDELMKCVEQTRKYHEHLLSLSNWTGKRRSLTDVDETAPSEASKWDYTSCIVLAFTIVTTIGYGHIAPSTVAGRIFCILYGLLGIPLTLLAIADHGRFLSSGLQLLYKKAKLFFGKARKTKDDETPSEQEDDEEEDSLSPALLLFIYIFYLVGGSFLLGSWEDGWSFLDSLYFSFISLSTIGFGDVVPKNYTYLPLVLLYIGVGLVLSSSAIDILAEYLRKLHQFGMKISNVQVQKIWFGGKALTVKDLVSSVGKYLGADEETMAHLVEHLDMVVMQTIEEKETGIPAEPQLLLSNREPLPTPVVVANHVDEKPETPKRPPTPKAPTPPPVGGFGHEVDFIDDRDDE